MSPSESAPTSTFASNDPVRHFGPAWFGAIMGLSGLALAWHRAESLLGTTATAVAVVLAVFAAVFFVALAAAAVLRGLRHADAWQADLAHPVRQAFIATIPISLMLLATAAQALGGLGGWVRYVWLLGSLGQLGVTLWVLGRWLREAAPGAQPWAAVTPVLIVPVVGNVIAPLSGGAHGFGLWATAQFGIGVLLWPVVLTLIFARLMVVGRWPERLLPSTFITVAPPAVIGSSALQLGASHQIGWMAWGVALFFVLWSARVLRPMLSQPFAVTFWAVSFPLAAFAALTLRLVPTAGWPDFMRVLALAVLALASLVIAGLLVATLRGIFRRELPAAEPA